MDFTIVTDGIEGEMTFDPATNIMNNIFLSVMVTQGSFFQNPNFGIRKMSRMKNTDHNAQLIVQYHRAALQWLIDTAKATKIDIDYQIDILQNINRLKLLIRVTQVNGYVAGFTKFVEVV